MYSDTDVTTRALGYPYERPSKSFVFSGDGEGSWVDISGAILKSGSSRAFLLGTPACTVHSSLTPGKETIAESRTAVLAIGSNASPEQLARKFPGNGWEAIPVLRAELAGFDVVYSPLVSSYGSICATLTACDETANTSVEVFITMLDDKQLRRMHETEGGYHVAQISDASSKLIIAAQSNAKSQPDESEWHWPSELPVFSYVSRVGVFIPKGIPVAYTAIPARDRKLPSMTQEQMQREVLELCQRTGRSGVSQECLTLTDFVLLNVRNSTVRAKTCSYLQQHGIFPDPEGVWEIVEDDLAELCKHASHVN